MLAAAARLLPTSELDRVGRLRREPDRNRALVGQLAVRALVAGRRSCDMREVVMPRSAAGRPELEGTGDVSIAHAGALVAVAYSEAGRVGIDVESVKDVTRVSPTTFLHPADLTAAQREPDPAVAFAALWSTHEAMIKLRGYRLAKPLTSQRLGWHARPDNAADTAPTTLTVTNGCTAVTRWLPEFGAVVTVAGSSEVAREQLISAALAYNRPIRWWQAVRAPTSAVSEVAV